MRATEVKDIEADNEIKVTIKEKAPKKEKKSSAGRKVQGKSKATNRITFYVDDEQLEYLIELINYKEKLSTPSAVAKKLFLTDYQLHGRSHE